jgi:hypothetical protein
LGGSDDPSGRRPAAERRLLNGLVVCLCHRAIGRRDTDRNDVTSEGVRRPNASAEIQPISGRRLLTLRSLLGML